MKVVEYKTICAEDTIGLDAEVNKHLALGFQLYGHPYSRGNMVAQALIKHGLREQYPHIETVPAPVIDP